MAIGRVVSVHFYSYAPWRAYGLKKRMAWQKLELKMLRPMEGVWIENTATIKGNENLVATPHGGRMD